MVYLTLATLFSGLTFFMVKVVTTKIYPLLGNIISILVAFLVQLCIFLYFKSRGTDMHFTKEGVGVSLLVGVLVALYTFFLFLAFSKLDVSKATPILYIGSLAIATLLSVIFLGEHLKLINWLGFVLAALSIILLLWR